MQEPEPKKRLTDLELEIMQVIWDAQPERLMVRAVVDRLAAGGRPLAYTTVQTMLTILRKKGVVDAHPGPGRAHEYEALVTRSDARSSMTADFVERLFLGHAEPLMAQLLDHGSMGRSELEELKRRIETQLEDEEEER
jgi:predicted transcriptional regulator